MASIVVTVIGKWLEEHGQDGEKWFTRLKAFTVLVW